MSDYHHARKMETCPSCEDGEDCARGKYKFECDNCGMMFP